MLNTDATHYLLGRLIIRGEILSLTGMRIGAEKGGLGIGTVDAPIVRETITGKPYIPGSSLKGKMRSLAEKVTNAPLNKHIQDIRIHSATNPTDYANYWVNPIFGVAPADFEGEIPAPNRLIVRDVTLSEASVKQLESTKTDLPYTEIKWEAAIDRVTSAAAPRQIERVPAGAVFSPMELVFNLYLSDDQNKLFPHLITCLQLVEDDYLGGHGSRGSGKVAFKNLTLTYKHGATYAAVSSSPFEDLAKLKAGFEDWLAKVTA